MNRTVQAHPFPDLIVVDPIDPTPILEHLVDDVSGDQPDHREHYDAYDKEGWDDQENPTQQVSRHPTLTSLKCDEYRVRLDADTAL